MSHAGPQMVGMATNWTLGDPCKVIYTEDGQAYDAVIEDLNSVEDFAIVYFVNWPDSNQVRLFFAKQGTSYF